MAFKIGQRVRNSSEKPGYNPNFGKEGSVTAISSDKRYSIAYDDGASGVGEYSDYTAIKSLKTVMKKVSTMMQKLLDADTQTLVKAGYINGDLEMTERGMDALNTIVFMANKAEMVASAQAALDEEKADKND